jgi:hypothetical protein
MSKICVKYPKNLIKKVEGVTQAHFEGTSYSCLLEITICHASYQQQPNMKHSQTVNWQV